MADEEIQSLERFILAEDKEESLRHFPTTSSRKLYLEANSILSLDPFSSRLTDILKLLEGSSEFYQKLQLRVWLKQYESSGDIEISKKINSKYFNYDFSYSAPRNIQSEEVEQFPHALTATFPDVDSAATNEKVYNLLSAEARFKIPLLQTSDQIFKKQLSGGELWKFSDVPQRFIQYYGQNKVFTETECFKNMTLTQLNQIAELEGKVWTIDTFVKAWLKKEYFLKSFELSDEQKYELMKVIAVEVKGNPRYMDAVKTIVLLNVLTLEMQLGKCEEVWFMDYLQFHRSHGLYNNPKNNYEKRIKVFEELQVTAGIDEQKLLQYYISTLLTRGKTIAQFEQFVNIKFLQGIHFQVLTLRGEPIESIEKEFLQAGLLTSIELEPCLDNPKEFTRTELVKFSMNVKNIPRLLVKVLEINPKSYFLTNNRAISSDLKLDGLIAKSEYSFEYSEPAQVRVRREFEFPELSDKVGVFFIELFGNGRHSRVIVKKGCLRYVSRTTSAGHLLYVMDEDNNICKENAGVYLDSRFYEANPQDGRINIPFARTTSKKNIILTDGAIAEFVANFNQLSENYEMKTAFIFHKEQMIAGEHVSIFVKPKLLVNGMKAPDSLLSECKATVTTVDIDSVSSTKTFADLVIPSDSGAIEIEISVPPRLRSVEIEFSAEVESTEGKKLPLRSSYSAPINTDSNPLITSSAFLRMTPNEFLIEIIGKNGEPVSRQKVEITVRHLYWKDPVTQTLSSDAQGVVHLGNLEQVSELTAQVVKETGAPENYLWKIQPLRGKIEYPAEIKLCEGDEFGVPLQFSEETWRNEIWFFSEVGGSILDCHLSSMTYDAATSMLMLNKLDAGTYSLRFKNSETVIKIVVLEGVHLDHRFILKENSAVVTNNDYMAIGIRDIQVNEAEISVNLSGNVGEGSVVYALLFNFITPELLDTITELRSLSEANIPREMRFDRPSNFYMQSTALDEEYQYVLDRKKLPRFVGSTLDKPQLLLKRLFLKDTKTETQQARGGGAFAQKLMSRAMDMQEHAMRSGGPGGFLRVHNNIPLDFLRFSALRLVVPVENNQARFSVSEAYSNLLVIAYNSTGLSYGLHPLTSSPQKKDLRLKNSSVDCIEICKARALFEGDVLEIEDYSSTSIEIVDSMHKLFKIMRDMISLNRRSMQIEEWSFLIDWPKLSLSKKKELYDKYASHELNLFLLNRDPDFFEKIVKPFVMCKMKKDLIDMYLCGLPLDQWCSFDSISKLNYLEIALLVHSIRDTKPDLAAGLVKMLKDTAGALDPDEQSRSARIEAVLNANFAEAGESRGGGGGGGGSGAECYEDEDEVSNYKNDSQSRVRMDQKSVKSKKTMLMCSGPTKERSMRKEESNEIEERKAVQQYYKKPEGTKEFCETYYYNQTNSVISLSAKFFSELSDSFLNRSLWLSETILECTSSLTELVLVLAFAAVPYKQQKHAYVSDGKSWKITSASPCMAFYKELTKAEVDISSQVFAAVKYLEELSPGTYSLEVKQFVKEKIYMCKVVITNTSREYLRFSILAQVPEGSIPLIPLHYSKTHFIDLNSYSTGSIDFFFYFPHSGLFNHNPASISLKSKVIAKIDSSHIQVQDFYDVSNLESFKDLVISGRKDLILEYLRNENLKNSSKGFDLGMIYWMMKNKEFWAEAINIYRSRFSFDATLWSYGFYHNDISALSELLSVVPHARRAVGYHFRSGILSTAEEDYKHTEFDPLVNARAYRLGNQERITNTRFKEVYKAFLCYLSEKNTLENSDLLCLCQYLILQERYNEANDIHKRIAIEPSLEKAMPNHLQIQYDYLTCYLDLEKARTIAPLYRDYPVPTWNKHFTEVLTLLQEIEAEDSPQTITVKSEPTLNFNVENNNIVLNYENVQNCTIRIYEIDLEILFSKNPFLIKNTESFSYVKANAEFKLELSGNSKSVPLDAFQGKNVLIEVDYKTYVVSKSHFSNMLAVNCIERFGVIKVMNSDRRPRPAAYVKAYVKRKNGTIEFYKDGYTDIRGKMDYVSLNTDTLSTIDKFALLIVDDELGSMVLEANPPPQ